MKSLRSVVSGSVHSLGNTLVLVVVCLVVFVCRCFRGVQAFDKHVCLSVFSFFLCLVSSSITFRFLLFVCASLFVFLLLLLLLFRDLHVAAKNMHAVFLAA